MEHKKQTGHICRWMAGGIMAAILIIGCTIMIGLSEWHDRKEIECRNTELHEWRKDMHDLNMHIAEMSLLGETVADWDTTDVEDYHQLRMEVDCMLLDMGKMNRQIETEDLRQLFVEKERLLLQIRNAVQKRNDIHEELKTEVPKIVAKSKKEQQVQSSTPRPAVQKKKRGSVNSPPLRPKCCQCSIRRLSPGISSRAVRSMGIWTVWASEMKPSTIIYRK